MANIANLPREPWGTLTAADEGHPSGPLELAVVIPTFNERENIGDLYSALERALAGIAWEAIFVDDASPDGTAQVLRKMARANRGLHVIERIGRRGLSSACIEGMLATSAPYLAIIDADLQHDEKLLPVMLEKIKSEDLELVVASRNTPGGSMGDFARRRVWLSNMGLRLSRLVCKCNVTDPMSGFFMIRQSVFHAVAPRLTGTGFKILIDVLASSRRPLLAGEVPYHFRNRKKGDSKLDANVELEYLFLLLDKLIGSWIPTRFILYLLVGGLGLLVHLSILALLHAAYHLGFSFSQVSATVSAMTFNFLLNNIVTFRDRRLRGLRLVGGLLTFYLACSVGAFVNVSFARALVASKVPWYVAGIGGLGISSIWNYVVVSILTWRRNTARASTRTPTVATPALQ